MNSDRNFESSLITNFSVDRLELFQQAILHDEGLYIQLDAFNKSGRPIRSCYSLHSKFPKDRSNFWECLLKLEEQKNSGMERWTILPEEFEKQYSKLK